VNLSFATIPVFSLGDSIPSFEHYPTSAAAAVHEPRRHGPESSGISRARFSEVAQVGVEKYLDSRYGNRLEVGDQLGRLIAIR
jgi:hypothetical protein